MQYKIILFDFDGVLCHDRFYEKTLLPKYQETYDWIQENIFSSPELIRDWMQGKISYQQINQRIADGAKINFKEINDLFLESVRLMNLDQEVLKLSIQLKEKDYRIGVVTDNMDVFSEVTIKNHGLDKMFEIIVNSADTKALKNDNNGHSFDLVMEQLGEDNYSKAVMIDDSESTIKLFRSKGGHGILFTDIEKLEQGLTRLGIND